MKYKIISGFLIIVAVILLGMITNKYMDEYQNEEQIQDKIIEFEEIQETEQTEKKLEYKGYTIIGKIKIPKIGIEYPILEIENVSPQDAETPMKISIIKYWGGKVNDYGNLSIAGHNNKSGTMFGKLKKLEKGDIVELTDLESKTIQYSIYDIFIVEPDDLSILLTKDENVREITLITCTNGNKKRLIFKGKEVL